MNRVWIVQRLSPDRQNELGNGASVRSCVFLFLSRSFRKEEISFDTSYFSVAFIPSPFASPPSIERVALSFAALHNRDGISINFSLI